MWWYQTPETVKSLSMSVAIVLLNDVLPSPLPHQSSIWRYISSMNFRIFLTRSSWGTLKLFVKNPKASNRSCLRYLHIKSRCSADSSCKPHFLQRSSPVNVLIWLNRWNSLWWNLPFSPAVRSDIVCLEHEVEFTHP